MRSEIDGARLLSYFARLVLTDDGFFSSCCRDRQLQVGFAALLIVLLRGLFRIGRRSLFTFSDDGKVLSFSREAVFSTVLRCSGRNRVHNLRAFVPS